MQPANFIHLLALSLSSVLDVKLLAFGSTVRHVFKLLQIPQVKVWSSPDIQVLESRDNSFLLTVIPKHMLSVSLGLMFVELKSLQLQCRRLPQRACPIPSSSILHFYVFWKPLGSLQPSLIPPHLDFLPFAHNFMFLHKIFFWRQSPLDSFYSSTMLHRKILN